MKKILVIDDEVDICMLLKQFLSKKGFNVENAQSGRKGLQLLEDFEPNLVMSDFRLGDFTGTDLLVNIQSQYPHIPVLIITGFSAIKDVVNVLNLGAYHYFSPQPLSEEIFLTVNKAIEDV